MRKAARRILGLVPAGALVAAGSIAVWTSYEARRQASRKLHHAFDPAFLRLSPGELAMLPVAARFDMPLGAENGALTYNARAFRMSRHLGEDLNGIGGGNTDLGDSVHAAGDGRVVYAGLPHESWGRMILIAHRLPEGDELGPVIQTMYAHLRDIHVRPGDVVKRGQVIGSVGTAGSAPLAHLHFEVRCGPYVNPGQGYADTPLNRVSPEVFIRARRGSPPDTLNPAL